MKTILFPTDFSKNADNALQYALGFARSFRAKLFIFHAQPLPITDPSMPAFLYDDLSAAILAGANTDLDQFVKKLRDQDEVDVEALVRIGPTVDEIVRVAKEKAADLIIMGTKGASNALDEWMGTETWAAIEYGTCPVLAVPENARFDTLSSIVFAADYKQIKKKATLALMTEIMTQFGAHLKVLNVNPDLEHISARQIDAGERLESYFEDTNLTFHFSYAEDIPQAIEHFVEEQAASLLVMIHRKRPFLKELFHQSITKKVVLHSHIPLLVLPDLDYV